MTRSLIDVVARAGRAGLAVGEEYRPGPSGSIPKPLYSSASQSHPLIQHAEPRAVSRG